MKHLDTHHPFTLITLMRRVVDAASRRGRLIWFLAFFLILTIVASFVPVTATVLKVLLGFLFVLFLNLITFRGATVQDFVQKGTRYFGPTMRRPPAPIPLTADS